MSFNLTDKNRHIVVSCPEGIYQTIAPAGNLETARLFFLQDCKSPQHCCAAESRGKATESPKCGAFAIAFQPAKNSSVLSASAVDSNVADSEQIAIKTGNNFTRIAMNPPFRRKAKQFVRTKNRCRSAILDASAQPQAHTRGPL
jgi:hypothetical protein